MRWLPLPFLLACRVAPTDCSVEACEPICADHERQQLWIEDQPISELAARMLADDIAELRAGVQPLHDHSIGLCAGERRCSQPLPNEDALLPASGGVLRALVRLPKRMPESRIEAVAWCPHAERELEWRNEVLARPDSPGAPVRLDPLLRIPPLTEPLSCHWIIRIEHPAHVQTLVGTFRSERLTAAPAAAP